MLDNIPLFSWIRQAGRCRSCDARIPVFHLLVEALTPAVAVAIAISVGRTPMLGPSLLVVPIGVAVAVIDLRTLMVPTRIVWPAFALMLVACGIVAATQNEPRWLVGGLIGVAGLAGPLFAIWWVHPRGMGFGDVRLAVLLGWTVGFTAAPGGLTISLFAAVLAMSFAAVAGLAIALAVVSFRRQVPFGPALVAGSLICIAGADEIARAFVR